MSRQGSIPGGENIFPEAPPLTAALFIPKFEHPQTRDVGLFAGISHLEWLVRSLQAGHGVIVSKGNPVFSLLLQFNCLYENRSWEAGFNKGKGLPANGHNQAENPYKFIKKREFAKRRAFEAHKSFRWSIHLGGASLKSVSAGLGL